MEQALDPAETVAQALRLLPLDFADDLTDLVAEFLLLLEPPEQRLEVRLLLVCSDHSEQIRQETSFDSFITDALEAIGTDWIHCGIAGFTRQFTPELALDQLLLLNHALMLDQLARQSSVFLL